MISLKEWRYSKAFRFVSLLVLLDFLTSQNIYAQEFHVQEGIHLYTPVGEAGANRIEKRAAKISLKVFVAETLQLSGVNATPPKDACPPDGRRGFVLWRKNQDFLEIFIEKRNKSPYCDAEKEAKNKMKNESYSKTSRGEPVRNCLKKESQ